MRPVLFLLLALAISPGAQAYTGPGLGLGVIGAILGVVFSLLLAMLAVFWYPLKRALKIGQRSPEAEDEIPEEEPQPVNEKTSNSG